MARRVIYAGHGRPEAAIQAAIVLVLRVKYHALVAVTDAGVLRKRGVTTHGSGIPDGWPDLTVLLPGGRFVGVEVKSERGRQSKMQKLMESLFAELGHEYVLARSVDDVIAAVDQTEREST